MLKLHAHPYKPYRTVGYRGTNWDADGLIAHRCFQALIPFFPGEDYTIHVVFYTDDYNIPRLDHFGTIAEKMERDGMIIAEQENGLVLMIETPRATKIVRVRREEVETHWTTQDFGVWAKKVASKTIEWLMKRVERASSREFQNWGRDETAILAQRAEFFLPYRDRQNKALRAQYLQLLTAGLTEAQQAAIKRVGVYRLGTDEEIRMFAAMDILEGNTHWLDDGIDSKKLNRRGLKALGLWPPYPVLDNVTFQGRALRRRWKIMYMYAWDELWTLLHRPNVKNIVIVAEGI